jgi:hypothetical protein
METVISIEVEPDSQPLAEIEPEVCLFSATPADILNCRMYWAFNEVPLPSGETLDSCEDLPFLEAVDDGTPGVSHFTTGVGAAHVCFVKQVSSSDESAQGWYPMTRLHGFPGTCLHFTSGISFLDGLSIWVTCPGTQTIARDGKLIDSDPALCTVPDKTPKHASETGKSCQLTTVPDGGFNSADVYVETNSSECGMGTCLVYHLEGDPNCKASDAGVDCAGHVPLPATEAAKRMYCSCRCDAPEGDPGELCTCDPGYACTPSLNDGPAGVRGSYCVRRGTISAL